MSFRWVPLLLVTLALFACPQPAPPALDGGWPGDGGTDAGSGGGGADAGDGGLAPDGGAADGGSGDAGVPDTFCHRASACGPGLTCNLSSGACEVQVATRGSTPGFVNLYPLEGAPGDYLVLDGQDFYTGLLPDLGARLTVGTASYTATGFAMDETRLVAVRTVDATGAVQFTGQTGTAAAIGPVETSSFYAAEQRCTANDPPAPGRPGAEAADQGPFAAGFADSALSGGLRVYYPAQCGGLRRPPATGHFPLVMILHGDGCVPLNYEYLGRHLASWGYVVAAPETTDVPSLRQILTDGLTAPEHFFASLQGATTGTKAVIIGHSKGTERTALMLQAGETRVHGVIFLGPATTVPYFPLPGLIIGATGDLQSTPASCTTFYNQLPAPKSLAVLQGGNHSQFTDAKHWEGLLLGDQNATMLRNRQFELVQSLVLAQLQRFFSQTERFPQWLADPGLPTEVAFQTQ